MDSDKDKKAKPLTLEARHTKSLAASKEKRLKFEQTIFIPRRHYYYNRWASNGLKKTCSKFKNSQDQENSKNVQSLAMQLNEKCSKKLICIKSCKAIENNNNNKKLSQNNASKYKKTKRMMPSSKVTMKNLKKSTSISNSSMHSHKPSFNKSNSTNKEPAAKFKAIADRNSPDIEMIVIHSEKTNKDTFETETVSNSIGKDKMNNSGNKEAVNPPTAINTAQALKCKHKPAFGSPFEAAFKDFIDYSLNIATNWPSIAPQSRRDLRTLNKASSVDVANRKKTEQPNLINAGNISTHNKISKTSGKKENVAKPVDLQLITKNNSNQVVENNLLEEVIAEASFHPQIIEVKTLNPPIANNTIEAENRNHKSAFGNLFEADFQNFVRYSLNSATDVSAIDRQISRDLRLLDNCMNSFSKCVSQIYKDLDDKELETQNVIEYARRRHKEREKLVQPEGLPTASIDQQPTIAEEIPKTFTIFIEAATLPKTSITFEATDILHPKTINASNAVYPDVGTNPEHVSKNQRNTKQYSPHNTSYLNSDTDRSKSPVLSSNSWSQNQSNNIQITGRQKSKKRLKQVPKKVKPIKPIPINAQIQAPSTTSIAANYLNSQFNYNATDTMYSNLHSTAHYYNLWPEANLLTNNSWRATAEEQWHKRNFYGHFQNFNREPTIVGPSRNFEPNQYDSSLSTVPFARNHYLHRINESNVCHTVMPNYLPTTY